MERAQRPPDKAWGRARRVQIDGPLTSAQDHRHIRTCSKPDNALPSRDGLPRSMGGTMAGGPFEGCKRLIWRRRENGSPRNQGGKRRCGLPRHQHETERDLDLSLDRTRPTRYNHAQGTRGLVWRHLRSSRQRPGSKESPWERHWSRVTTGISPGAAPSASILGAVVIPRRDLA